MKHEILFRGRRLDNGEWVEGHFFRSSTRAYIITMVDDTGTWAKSPRLLFVEVDPDTVGQFTDESDKKGKRIAEGDICTGKSIFHDYTEKFIVIWRNNGFFLAGQRSGNDYCFDNCEDIEVIGNAFDNPGADAGGCD